MFKQIAITTAAFLALSAPAFAGAHTQADDQGATASDAGADAGGVTPDGVPSGLTNTNASTGLTAATTKGGNGD